MRICVLGNSHVAALKRAWNRIDKEYEQFSFTFFAQRGPGLQELYESGGEILCSSESLKNTLRFTSGGEGSIAPKNYDIFLIYGLDLFPYFSNPGVFTAAAQKQACMDHVEASTSFYLLTLLRKVTQQKIYFGHVPLGPRKKQKDTTGTKNAYFEGLRALNFYLYSSLNAEVVAQPKVTIVNGRNTLPKYTRGSRRLAIGADNDDEFHPEDDAHMNDFFGELWLRDFFSIIPSSRG